MSLAPAKKDISDSPARMGVTEPTNPQVLEADVQRKMKLYGVIQAFRRGRLPQNSQIDQALRYLEGHSPVNLNKLSPEGRKLVDDCRGIIETMRLQVNDKNKDEVLQQFIHHTSNEGFQERAAAKGREAVTDGGALPSKDAVQQDGRQAVEHLRTLAQLILTNSEARKLVSDAGLISRDLFAKGASNLAERARPDADRMARVDDPAPSQAWGGDHSQGGRSDLPTVGGDIDVQKDGFRGAFKKGLDASKAKAEERADQRANETAARTGAHNAAATQPSGAGYNAQPSTGGTQPTAGYAPPHSTGLTGGAYDQSGLTTTGFTDSSATQQPGTFGAHTGQRPAGDNTVAYADAYNTATTKAPVTDVDPRHPVDSAKQEAQARLNAIDSKIPEKHKDRARLEKERARKFLDEEFPQERRDQFIWRMKKVVTECQSHPNYQTSMTWFLDTLDNYFRSSKDASKSQGRNVEGVFGNDPVVQQAWDELRVLIERFANGRTLDGFFDAITKLRDDTRSDEEFRAWWRRAREFIRRSLLEPGFILSPQWDHTSDAIFKDEAKHFFDERYQSQRQRISDEAQYWLEGWKADPLNRQFVDGWSRLAKDLLFDQNGSLTWKSGLWRDIRTVILPEILEQVGYVPIPRIEYTDNAIDLVVENLTLQGKNLFPNLIDFVSQTHIKFSPYHNIKDEMHHSTNITLSQIQADMRDVAFYVNKKSGFPKIKDSGLADVFLGGKGITVKLKVSNVAKEKSHGVSASLLRLDSCIAKVDTLKFSIRDSKHDLLYKTMRPLATGLIKKQIQKAIEDGIKTAFEFIDAELVKVRQRAEEAKHTAVNSEGSWVDRAKQTANVAKEGGGGNSTTSVSGSGTSGAPGSVRGHDLNKMEHPISTVSSKAEKRNSRFKVVADRDSSILPDAGHRKGWVNKVVLPEVKGEGEGWKSNAFSVVPTGHTTGHHATGHANTTRTTATH